MISFRELIVECLQKTDIYEMAYNRSKYIDTVDSLKDQLIENWCLIRYFRLKNEYVLSEHSENELCMCINDLYKMVVKTDKRRATVFALKDQPEIKTIGDIRCIISKKWFDENLNVNDDITTQVCDDCITYGINEMIELISSKPRYFDELKDYVKNL